MKKYILVLFSFSIHLLITPSDTYINTYELEDVYRSFERIITVDNPIVWLDEPEELPQEIHRAHAQKNWTFIVYIAADNDLRAFASNNVKQMLTVGSNEHLNIVIHIDMKVNNNKKITKRYYVEKNKLVPQNDNDPLTQSMDSGDPKTLVSCCNWAINNYPATNYALILWNHGTGIIDPRNYKIINPAELFTFNPITNKFDLDRTTGFLDLLYYLEQDHRGICWDNTTGNYLTNAKLNFALNEICTKVLKRKFNIIAFDACLMSMIEIASAMKNFAHIMVGSQEVELGTGWNYNYVLSHLIQPSQDMFSLARHIVSSYQNSYFKITNDFTQSSIDLNEIEKLEKNIDAVAQLLISALHNQNNNSVKNGIREARNKKNCTHFEEPSYIDLHHFYSNLIQQLSNLKVRNANIIQQLRNLLEEGKQLIKQVVISNTTGNNLSKAQGISIYFPEQKIHDSYPLCDFAKTNNWYQLLHTYLR